MTWRHNDLEAIERSYGLEPEPMTCTCSAPNPTGGTSWAAHECATCRRPVLELITQPRSTR